MRRIVAGAAAVTVGLGGSLMVAPALAESAAPEVEAAKSAGPKVRWDWSMPPGMVDEKTWNRVDDPSSPHYIDGGYFTDGPDGMPDQFMKSVKGYSAAGKARYGKLPKNDLHKVYLDASGSTGTGSLKCSWTIETDVLVKRKNKNCDKQLAVKLPNGKYPLSLKVTDSTGTTTVDSKIHVKNILIGIIGDSYGSGEGFPPFTRAGFGGATRELHWDEAACNRSHWSGFVRSAQTVENADHRSNVTLLDVACAGAQVSKSEIPGRTAGGIISPQPVSYTHEGGTKTGLQPPQTDQLRAIVGDRPFDNVLLSIGGNDVGFSPISKACLLEGQGDNCYSKPAPWAPGEDLWVAIDHLLLELEKRYARMAPCVSSTGGNKACKTFKITGGDSVADKRTKSKPVVLRKSSKLLHAMYPDLTTTTNAQGDIVPCYQDGLLPQSPMNQISNSWAWDAAYQGEPGKPITLPTIYSPPLPTPDPAVITPSAYGLAKQVVQNQGDYGWTPGLSMLAASRGHGLCATDEPWLYGIRTALTASNPANQSGAEHPNDDGQAAYADMMGPMAEDLTGVPVNKPKTVVRSHQGLG
ncbi:MAG: hypothetical protein KDC39_11405 [Actinobacteria bacterium]|nr:hypothetical protein [Actinomycetota bacterium]